jgi:hypothetical protein
MPFDRLLCRSSVKRPQRVLSLFASRIQSKFAAAPLHQSLTWCTRSSCRRVRLAGQGKARRAPSHSVQELQTGRVETLFQLHVSRRDMRLHRFPERTRSFLATNNPVHQKQQFGGSDDSVNREPRRSSPEGCRSRWKSTRRATRRGRTGEFLFSLNL